MKLGFVIIPTIFTQLSIVGLHKLLSALFKCLKLFHLMYL